MAKKRERKLPPEFIKQFIETYDIKNTDDILKAGNYINTEDSPMQQALCV